MLTVEGDTLKIVEGDTPKIVTTGTNSQPKEKQLVVPIPFD